VCSRSKVLRTSGGASPARGSVGRLHGDDGDAVLVSLRHGRASPRPRRLQLQASGTSDSGGRGARCQVSVTGDVSVTTLQLAPERTERGRHRQPSAGEASKTTPAPLTEPHLIPVCRYVPLLLLGYLSAVYTALQKQRFKMAKYGHYANHDLFLQIRIRIRSGCPVFFSFSSCCFFCCYHSPAVHWHCAESHTRTGRRLVARLAGRTNPCLEGNALPLN
jgi:hypothetical protein